MIKVRAIRMGFYGNLRRREGQEFEVKSKAEIGNWMEVIKDESEPVKEVAPVGESVDKIAAAEELATKKAVAEAMLADAESANAALKNNSSKADKAAAAELMTLAKQMLDEVAAELLLAEDDKY